MMGDQPAQRLLDLLFPPRCVHCGQTGALLCGACRAEIHVAPAPRCERCDWPLRFAAPARCPWCAALATRPQPPALDRIVVGAIYDGSVASAIRALKFRGQRRLALPLAVLAYDAVRRADLRLDCVIAMPLHADRRRERGYNQATLLARPLAAALRAPLREDALTRTRATQPQTQLSHSARHANVAGAFALTRPAVDNPLAGKRILLVDDVTTTGATLDAAAQALAAARPAAIYACVVARPMRPLWPDDPAAPES